jgi:hypothetical protein
MSRRPIFLIVLALLAIGTLSALHAAEESRGPSGRPS